VAATIILGIVPQPVLDLADRASLFAPGWAAPRPSPPPRRVSRARRRGRSRRPSGPGVSRGW